MIEEGVDVEGKYAEYIRENRKTNEKLKEGKSKFHIMLNKMLEL